MRIWVQKLLAATIAVVGVVAISNAANAAYNVVGASAASNALVVKAAAGQAAGGVLSGIAGGAAGGVFGGPNVASLRSGSTGLSAGDGQQRFGIWANGFYDHQKFDNALLPFDGNIFSGTVGLDYIIRDGIVVGLAAGYENSDFNDTFDLGTQKTNGYTVAPYAAFSLGKYLTLSGTFGYSGLSTDVTRSSGAIRGSFDSTRWFGATTLSGNYRAQNWVFNGSIGYIYTHQKDDGYTETGVGGGVVGGVTTKIGQGRLGAKIGYDFNGIMPYASARIDHEFTHPGDPIVGGQTVTFDTTGYVLGGGVALTRGNISAGLEADTVLGRSNTTEYQILGNIRLRF